MFEKNFKNIWHAAEGKCKKPSENNNCKDPINTKRLLSKDKEDYRKLHGCKKDNIVEISKGNKKLQCVPANNINQKIETIRSNKNKLLCGPNYKNKNDITKVSHNIYNEIICNNINEGNCNYIRFKEEGDNISQCSWDEKRAKCSLKLKYDPNKDGVGCKYVAILKEPKLINGKYSNTSYMYGNQANNNNKCEYQFRDIPYGYQVDVKGTKGITRDKDKSKINGKLGKGIMENVKCIGDTANVKNNSKILCDKSSNKVVFTGCYKYKELDMISNCEKFHQFHRDKIKGYDYIIKGKLNKINEANLTKKGLSSKNNRTTCSFINKKCKINNKNCVKLE